MVLKTLSMKFTKHFNKCNLQSTLFIMFLIYLKITKYIPYAYSGIIVHGVSVFVDYTVYPTNKFTFSQMYDKLSNELYIVMQQTIYQ